MTTTTTVTFEAEVTNKTLLDLFTTACEGGINYWCDLVEYHWSNWEGDKRVEDLEGFYAIVEDLEDHKQYRLDAEALRSALITCARSVRGDKNWPGPDASSSSLLLLISDKFPHMDIDVDYDAWVADCIAQVAMLGEVVYG